MSLVIHGATVVTSLAPPAVERVDLVVRGGRIAELGPPEVGDLPVLDAIDCLVVPGNVNAHMHAYAALARGMPYMLEPPRNFPEILQRIWWRLDRALDPAAIRASALVTAREALLAGTTTLVDHHASPNAIDGALDILADAFVEVGIRSILAYEVSDRDGHERAVAGIAENARFARRAQADKLPLARAMVGAHASFTLSDETLTACAALARSTGNGLHIHLAEDAVDRGAARRLVAAGALDERSLVAHAVHLDRTEAALLTERGVTVAHNARSNLNNGVGRSPLGWLGQNVALGTDGIGSDMWEEGRTAHLRRREEDLSAAPEWILARLAAGSAFAARAFGEPRLGTIAVGAPADLVVLDYRPPTALESTTLAAHWLFGLSSATVRDVIVGGELVVRGRRLTRVDEAALSADARARSGELWTRLEHEPARNR